MTRNDCRSMVRIAAAAFLPLLLSACLLLQTAAPPTQDIQAVYTSAAETMAAELTLQALETVNAQLTEVARPSTQAAVPPKMPSPTPPAPTDTVPPPTVVTAPSSTPTPPPTETPAIPCDRAELIGDVTVPPDTLLLTGSAFVKVWRVRNAGSCTWTPSYSLAYTGGNLTTLATQTFLPGNVLPGQTVDLSVSLTAPSFSGVYQGAWMLRNANGQMFGVGLSGFDPLTVRIRTFQATSGGEDIFDLTTVYCAANWRSGAGQLTCPGSPQDPNGSVVLLESPFVEVRRTGEFGLWVRPNQAGEGWITGVMPTYTVQSGDYFLAEIGCLQDSPGCDVIFELDYQTVGGASGRLGRWRETLDGVTTLIDVDLSELVGRSISLVLTVYNNGPAGDANAVWLQPRVQRLFLESAIALTWTREGYFSRSSCDELRIAFTSANTAVAQAFDCRQGSRLLGQILLTGSQFSQLSSWVQRLEDSEGEIYSATQERPVVSRVFLRGRGLGVATTEELRAIDSFAAQIFSLIVR